MREQQSADGCLYPLFPPSFRGALFGGFGARNKKFKQGLGEVEKRPHVKSKPFTSSFLVTSLCLGGSSRALCQKEILKNAF